MQTERKNTLPESAQAVDIQQTTCKENSIIACRAKL